MSVRSCRVILIAATLVVQSEAASCPPPRDTADIMNTARSVDPADVKPKWNSVGNVNLEHLWQEGVTSEGATCTGYHSGLDITLGAKVTAMLTRGTIPCPLKAIKVESADNVSAKIHLVYEGCASEPTKAIVTLDLEKVATFDTKDTVFGFVQAVCGSKTKAPTGPITAKATARMSEVEVGKGKCDARSKDVIDNVTVTDGGATEPEDIKKKTEGNCRQICMSETLKYANMKDTQVKKMNRTCQGYHYNIKKIPGTDLHVCTIFDGNFTGEKIGNKEKSDWVCKKIEPDEKNPVSYHERATTTLASQQQMSIRPLRGDNRTARGAAMIMTYHDGCFEPFDHISLRSNMKDHKKVTLKVPTIDYDAVLNLIKEKRTGRRLRQLATAPPIDIQLDHATHGTPPALTTTAAPTAPPAAPTATTCTVPSYLNGIITGAVVPAVVWLVVLQLVLLPWLASQTAGASGGKSGPPYAALSATGSSATAFSDSDRAKAVAGATVASLIISFVCSELFGGLILKSMCDSPADDKNYISITSAIATSLGCALAFYVLHSGTERKIKITIADENGRDVQSSMISGISGAEAYFTFK